ncbi:uncharacterized protein DS421_11g321410 [Arachis hypogaea]|nr:uncharacterized protein DS421_11g321410 [Arachis hypogaea]
MRLRHGSREILGVYDNPKRSGDQPGEMQSDLTNEELGMRERHPKTGGKAHSIISLPQRIGRQSPAILQLDEKGDSVRMDLGMRRSLQALQGYNLGTACPRET